LLIVTVAAVRSIDVDSRRLRRRAAKSKLLVFVGDRDIEQRQVAVCLDSTTVAVALVAADGRLTIASVPPKSIPTSEPGVIRRNEDSLCPLPLIVVLAM
jgi:hypothetical protein